MGGGGVGGARAEEGGREREKEKGEAVKKRLRECQEVGREGDRGRRKGM